MKINTVLSIISVLLSAVLTYLVYSLTNDSEEHIALLCVMSFVGFCSTLTMGIATTADTTGSSVNIKLVSFISAAIILIANVIFALVGVNQNALIIVDALVLIVFALLVYVFPKRV